MHLAVFAVLGLAASTAAQTTCDNFGTLRADGSCLCPPGFGGSTCSAPSCGGNIFQGSQRPVSQNSSTGGLSFAGCGCQDGWGGAGCNVCRSQNVCQSAFTAAGGSTNSGTSQISPNQVGNQTLTCSTQSRVYAAQELSCAVINPTLQAVFPLSAHLNLLRTFDPALSPSPNITSFGSAGSVLAQVFYDGVEQFSCSATSCRQAYSNDTSDWVCESLKCACRNGSAFCGANRNLDLTSTLNSLSGQLTVSCTDSSSSCSFKQSLLQSLFGPNGLGLSNCQFGECVRQSVIDSAMGVNSPSTSEANSLSGGVIAGLAVVGAFALGIAALVAWGCLVQRKARATRRDTDGLTNPRKVGVEWRNVGYVVQPSGSSSSFSWTGVRRRGKRVAVGSTSALELQDLEGAGTKQVASSKSRTILSSLSGTARPGQMLAILGPSGAGKTTLIGILAGRSGVMGGRVTGEVGFVVDGPGEDKVRIGFVDQTDVLPPMLTVTEALVFAARLKMPESVPDAAKLARVETVIRQLGLGAVAHSRIGGSEERGLSGGERRRVSIALEIVAGVEVLVLDEPTSGLDSVSAANVARVLSELAHDPENPVSVIASIHQPSSRLYHQFDQVLVLSRGEQIYFGPGGTAPVRDLEGRGAGRMEAGYNVADWLLEVASEGPGRMSSGEKRADEGLRYRGAGSSEEGTTVELRSGQGRGEYAATFLTQLQVLCGREWKNLKRDKTLFIMHLAVAVLAGVFTGGLYFNVGVSISGFQNRVGSLFFMGSMIAFSSLSALHNLIGVRDLFTRERAGGYYSPAVWLASRVLFDVLPLRVLPTVVLTSITYWMVGLAPEAARFFKALLVLVLYGLAMAVFNFLLASVFRNGGVAILLSSIFNLFTMTYAGFFVNLSAIPAVLRWLQWFSILKYLLEALAVNEVGSGLQIQDTLQGVPVNISAIPIMELLFGFGLGNYYREMAPAALAATTPVPTAVKASAAAGQFDTGALFGAAKAAREEAAAALAAQVKADATALAGVGFVPAVVAALGDKKSPAAREGACAAISVLCETGVGRALEPYITDDVFRALLEAFADKTPAVRTAALDAARELVQVMNPWAAALVLPTLLEQIRTAGKWQVKTGALGVLNQLIVSAPDQMAKLSPDIIPVLAEAIWDTKADVKKAARESLTKATALVSNKDIEKFIPALINALINPVEEVPKTIQLLSATTFVSEVDAPTLSLMVPLLERGLSERLTATKRKVAVIIDNMAKLVDNEHTVRPFIPKLLPGLIKIAEQVADPEARGVVNKAIATLRQVGKIAADDDGSKLPPPKAADPAALAASIVAQYKKAGANPVPDASHPAIAYAARLVANLVAARNYDVPAWETALVPYLELAAASPEPASIARDLLLRLANDGEDADDDADDNEEGEDLCNCQFSLAYGAKILLNTATLRLKRGHRYGLCGRNGSGKSTLMRAITNGQVEGFPSPDEVRTFYVEHDIDGSDADTSVLQFILSDSRVLCDEKEVVETLESLGFNSDRQQHAIGSLSGGWKMKLALARAMLFKADILLLDEPTNHLDVVNIAWLENYLKSLTTCTSIIVSHDSGFLNNTITDVLHLNRFKIKRYRGNLEDFVKAVPEAKSYYTLEAAEDYKFKLPDPPMLEGVKTKEKSLLKMRKVGFQYPSQQVQQLYDITLQVSLSSRVAVLGPNGSGKSTLVKLLIGDLEPNKGGEVWKHPNLVIGYVAQHAFHHIDHHLDKTPLEYMLWRYQTGEDMEEMNKITRQITEEEEKKMKEGGIVVVEGVKRIIEEIVSRKKLKQSYEYEVSFKNMSSTENLWLPRDELIQRGFEKKVIELDTREAQRLGLLRPLVRREIEKHFADFGLEPEFVSHNTMRGLSGGQKVKIVLGAATWRRPHVICLDEPTNYLDRESLAALIEALKVFEGGVLVITHNRDFSESLCKEVWAMRDGHLEASGHNWVEGQGSGPRIDKKAGEEEDQYDAMGNKVDAAKKAKKLTSNQERKLKKERMARRKAGLPSDDES